MQIYKPMQLSCLQKVLEVNRKYYWTLTSSMYIKLSTGEPVLEQDAIEDAMSTMGDIPKPDLGYPKPAGEWLVTGSAFSPTKKPVKAFEVSAQLEDQKKVLRIFGDREWSLGLPTEPIPISSMSLDYQFAFGGANFDKNPTGKGYKSELLPNIELLSDPIDSSHKPYDPAGLGPLDQTWAPRSQMQGTFDQRYVEKYYPGYPIDFDWQFFMTAPRDQRQAQYFKGTESFAFNNLNPDHPVIAGNLPGYLSKCFVVPKSDKNNETDIKTRIKELSMQLDTIWFYPEKDLAQLFWRTTVESESCDGSDISHCLLAFEQMEHPKKTYSHYESALLKRVSNYDPLEELVNGLDLIPNSFKTPFEMIQESATIEPDESAFAANMNEKINNISHEVQTKLDSKLQETSEKLSKSTMPEEQKGKLTEVLGKYGSDKSIDSSPSKKTDLEKLISELFNNSQTSKKIDLKNFTLDKLDDLMEKISKSADEQVVKAKSEMKPHILKLIQNLKLQKNELERSISSSTDNNVKSELEKLDQQIISLSKQFIDEYELDKPAMKLPRLDVGSIVSGLETANNKILQSLQQLQSILENASPEEKVKIESTKAELVKIIQDEKLNPDDAIGDAERGFFASYRSGAHLMDQGLSPHLDDADRLNRFHKKLSNLEEDPKALVNQDWSCLNLANLNLSGVDLSGCYLEQTVFDRATLTGVNFRNSILARASFNSSKLSYCNFDNSNLGLSDLSNSLASHCNLSNTILSGVNLGNARLEDCVIEAPDVTEFAIQHANFINCNLKNCIFLESSISNCKFELCNFDVSVIVNSNMVKVEFNQCQLQGTAWVNSHLTAVKFSKSNLTSNCFIVTEEGIEFQENSFTFSDLSKSNFSDLPLQNTNFEGSTLTGANFSGANLSNANLENCNAKQALLRKSKLFQTNMSRTDLMEAVLSQAIIVETNLAHSNLYGVDFIKATVEGTNFKSANLDATILEHWRPS